MGHYQKQPVQDSEDAHAVGGHHPTLFGLSRSPECEMKTGYANAMFGMVVIGTQAFIRIVFLLGYLCKRATSPVASVTAYV